MSSGGVATHHLLYVTQQLFELVRANATTCFFVNTKALNMARGNEAHKKKLCRLQDELFIEQPRCVNELPILVLNCTWC